MFFKEEENKSKDHLVDNETNLPKPKRESDVSLEETLHSRRSIRDFRDRAISLEEVSQLLWAGQGVTEENGKRATPSAGATYPLEVYIVANNVEGVEEGVYLFHPEKHNLSKILEGDVSEKLASAALGQDFIAQAPVNIVITGVYERTVSRYGERGERYVHMEAGHASQNIYLQCESLNLGTVTVGAFGNEEVIEVLKLNEEEEPLYIMPVGYPL